LACCAAVEDGFAVAADFCYWIFGSVELEAGFAACDGHDRGMLGCWCGEFDIPFVPVAILIRIVNNRVLLHNCCGKLLYD